MKNLMKQYNLVERLYDKAEVLFERLTKAYDTTLAQYQRAEESHTDRRIEIYVRAEAKYEKLYEQYEQVIVEYKKAMADYRELWKAAEAVNHVVELRHDMVEASLESIEEDDRQYKKMTGEI